MLARQPIDKAIAKAGEPLASQLTLTKQLKVFAYTELGLPNNKSYNSYVALKRDFPVWTVVAAEEFSVNAKQWCYLVIGCANYRGYFKRDSAIKYAEKLKLKGYETSVGGAPAYSTLGWFADPVLPSMLRYGDVEFAETLFHELAHQKLYVNGDSAFNEAFATVVGQAGAKQWLRKHRPEALSDYQEKLRATADFNVLLKSAKQSLDKVYQSDVSDAVKRELKQGVFDDLETNYNQVKETKWHGRGLFDSWFSAPLNNARLAGFSTYYDLVPDFEQLLASCDNDFPRFYRSVKEATENGSFNVPSLCI